jgi:hypothetical protein
LRGVIFHRSDLADAIVKDADLTRADLRGVQHLSCERLVTARGWEDAYRDPQLACGAIIPQEGTGPGK